MKKSCARQADQLANCLDSIPAWVKTCLLAFSGGLDSCVLLHLLANKSPPLKIKLWHVNHGLQSESGSMEQFCRQQADLYGFDLKLSRLNLQTTASNIEALARTARYDLFAKGLASNECLLTAHHADDQVETFLLNVLRGSGSAGLRGIARQKPIGGSILLRPMLAVKRDTLLDYAKQHDIEWFEDPSNSSDKFNRNYLRHNIVPLISQRWPNYHSSIGTVCEIQAETRQMLDELAALDYALVVHETDHADRSSLKIAALKSLSGMRQKNVIRYWLRLHHCSSLPKTRLDTLIKQLSAKQDAAPVVTNTDYDIRIYNGRLFIVDYQQPKNLKAVYDLTGSCKLEIAALGLVLQRQSVLKFFRIEDNQQTVQIRFRLDANSKNQHSHRLKRLFQNQKIAPWLRNSTPQVYIDGELVGLWV